MKTLPTNASSTLTNLPVSSPTFVPGTPGWIRDILERAGQQFNLPTVLLSALLKQESGFRPDAVSPVGAMGIAQFMPECVTTDTEILTLEGWKRWDEIKEGEEVLSYNPNTDLLEKDVVKEIKSYEQVRVVRMHNKRFDFISTPNHRWYVRHNKSGKIIVKTTEELNKNIKHHLIRATEFDFPVESDYSDELVELLGWIFSDGSISKHGKLGQVDIYQSFRANKDKCDKIDKLVVTLGGKNGKERAGGMMRWSITGQLAQEVVNLLGYEKRITPKLLTSITKHQAELLFDSCMDGDGHTYQHTNGSSYSHFIQAHMGRAEDFQLLTLFLGRITNLQTYIRKNKFQLFPDGSEYEVGIKIHANIRNDQNTQTDKRRMNYEEIEELMDVWCPVTTNQTWVAKRNGMVTITGNTAQQMGVNPLDPEDSIMGMAKYLRNALDQFGDIKLALAAYNAGSGAVAQYGGIPPYQETQDYVKNILAMAGDPHASYNQPYLSLMNNLKKQSQKASQAPFVGQMMKPKASAPAPAQPQAAPQPQQIVSPPMQAGLSGNVPAFMPAPQAPVDVNQAIRSGGLSVDYQPATHQEVPDSFYSA